MARQRLRFLHKHGLGMHRAEVGDGTAPVFPPLWVQPSAAPSGTAQEGDAYYDSTNHALSVYNSASWQQLATLGVAQSWTAKQTFSTAPAGAMGLRTIYGGATTLASTDNGALCLWNNATAFLYTLPVIISSTVGMWFDFVVTVTASSGSHKVITGNGSQFIVGSFLQIPDTAAQIVARAADGTTIRSWNGNGGSTGGFAGDAFRLVAISTTQWAINGIGLATGTEATPFATS